MGSPETVNRKSILSRPLILDKLPDTIDIVSNIIAIILSSNRPKPIQGIATELGLVLGYRNQINAVKTGAEILSICHGKLYDIKLSDDSTEIIPKYNPCSLVIDLFTFKLEFGSKLIFNRLEKSKMVFFES